MASGRLARRTSSLQRVPDGVELSRRPLEPPRAKGECPERLVDVGEELTRRWDPQRHVRRVEILHEVRALHVLDDVPAPRAAEISSNIKIAIA